MKLNYMHKQIFKVHELKANIRRRLIILLYNLSVEMSSYEFSVIYNFIFVYFVFFTIGNSLLNSFLSTIITKFKQNSCFFSKQL